MEPSISQIKSSTTLGGVTMWELFEPVSARLGKPRQVIDDKGAAFGTQYIYEGMTLWAGFDAEHKITVQQIEVTNPRYCTSSGVCPGMKVSEAQRILGKPILAETISDGRNDYLIGVEACWLELDVRNGAIGQLAIRCQP
jgi:hypothetical protein